LQLAPQAKRDKHSIYKGDYSKPNKMMGANAFTPISQIDEDSDEEDENCEVEPEDHPDLKDKHMGIQQF
jgi:hypothetical protein